MIRRVISKINNTSHSQSNAFRAAVILMLPAILCILFFSKVEIVKAAEGSLYLTPATGTFEIGRIFKVLVKVDTGGEEINAAEGSISYDTGLLEVSSITKGSLFKFWTTEPTAEGGSIKFGGGNPSPYKGAAGSVLTINFMPKKVGLAQVRFSSGAVLANDGKGTNILVSMGSGSYTVSPKTNLPLAETVDTDKSANPNDPREADVLDYNIPVVKSITHPDSNIWYQGTDVKLAWDIPAGVTDVSFLFDDKPDSKPSNASMGAIKEKEYLGIGGGMWYFHIKFKDASRWGTVAHYRIMIDTNPPNAFKINIKNIEIGEWPILEFETKDNESGLLKYEVYIGSLEQQAHKLDALNKSLQLSDLEPGMHTVLIKAIDKAGNQRIETIEFVIDPIATPIVVNYPAEVKPSDKFFLNGTAINNGSVIVYFEEDNKFIASSSTNVDANGNWFYIHNEKLDKGRYTAYVRAVNAKGMKSGESARLSFVVSPPIFTEIGVFIIDYFTVIVSLLFMIVLIILIVYFLVYFIRKKLKKETIEVEEVVKRNLNEFRKEIDAEFKAMVEKDTRISGRKDKAEIQARLRLRLDTVEKKIMKEVKDVEEILH